MDMKLQPIIDELVNEFGATAAEYHGDVSLVLAREKIVAACQKIQGLGFELLPPCLPWITGLSGTPRFHVIYEFTSVSMSLRFEVRVPVPGISRPDRLPYLPQCQLA